MDSRILVVAQRDRLPHIESCGGLVGRRTGAHTVHLVSSAATPLGGDRITVRVVVEPGALLRLRSVAAAIALPGPATPVSHAEMVLEAGGDLDVDLEPTVVAGSAEHHATLAACVGDTGCLRVRERVQIGRSAERHGLWSSTVRADAAGRPLLRHRVELGAGTVGDDVLAAPRAAISELSYPVGPRHLIDGGTVLELAGGGALTTWQGDVLPAPPPKSG
ncbi:urease accessory protein UreD [[Mycobacterium] wendilense]|uniref:Urease accessory protein UreD n=1 Tax=[Mycobacterium] wendilense TaxID=3064284 RepID=A0ABN9P1T8_9MYCO|nr:urease accessory protein UreD [Mycolicibacterium sp. MU0050]CAJ1582645.1 urease accessory protein UreD [Mycolicibacterium sp. MU0050]